jgi:hypothetical protein
VSQRLDRRTLSRATPEALRRLARFLGEPMHLSDHELVERLVRALDRTEGAYWPPRVLERRW